jgi:hypothetical protein
MDGLSLEAESIGTDPLKMERWSLYAGPGYCWHVNMRMVWSCPLSSYSDMRLG